MKGFVDDIEELTEGNDDFRRVLYTGKHLQLVLMALKPGEEIGEEVHEDRDQFFRVEAGQGEVSIDGQRHAIQDDDAIVVPAGVKIPPTTSRIASGIRTSRDDGLRTQPTNFANRGGSLSSNQTKCRSSSAR